MNTDINSYNKCNTFEKKIFIASDHAGFELKKKLIDYYLKLIDINDLGCYSLDSVDYPDFAQKLCINISDSNHYGILICGTGIGMSIAANRYQHIRCALVNDIFTSEMARKHNNANVISIGARTIDFNKSIEIIDTFIQTNFEFGRHCSRLNKI